MPSFLIHRGVRPAAVPRGLSDSARLRCAYVMGRGSRESGAANGTMLRSSAPARQRAGKWFVVVIIMAIHAVEVRYLLLRF
eukprot:5570391-Pleurochrysis_carterae.AAC.1